MLHEHITSKVGSQGLERGFNVRKNTILPVLTPLTTYTPKHPKRFGWKPDVLILTLGFSPNVGGVETHLDDLIRAFSERNHRIEIATLQPFTTEISAPKFETSELLHIRRNRWFGRNWFFTLARIPLLGFLYCFPAMLYSAIRARCHKPGIVFPQGLAAGAAAFVVFPRKRRVISIHSDINFSQNASRIASIILRSADHVLCISDRIRQQCLDMRVPENKVSTFRLWVDLERFHPVDRTKARAAFNLGDGFIALFVGRLIEEKGVRIVLDAELLVGSETQFLFAGVGPEESTIRRRCSTRPRVHFIGKISQERLPELYSAADILLVPSTESSQEGYPRVIMEALACGTPVIVTHQGSIPEAVSDEVSIFVEPNAESIAAAIDYLNANPELLNTMGLAARKLALERYSADNVSTIAGVLFGEQT